MLRIHDVLHLIDTPDINTSPGVVVIHFRGFKELLDRAGKQQAKMYNPSLIKIILMRGVGKAARVILIQGMGSRGLHQFLELSCMTGR